MSFTGTLDASLEEINSFLMFIWRNTACITIKRDGVECFFITRSIANSCIHCLSNKALETEMSERPKYAEKIAERIQAGDECLYEEKEYL